MRASQYYWFTLKEIPKDAELISHQLMLRAGLIKMIASGIYAWMPIGLRVLEKFIAIVRDEMSCIGANELLMPMIQPSELWQESGRWEEYGKELMRTKDRKNHDFCFGPTHEEVVSALVRNDVKGYKQLPFLIYQIQTKFRDEARPRAGVIRAREFLMKDAYSFHTSKTCLENYYQMVFNAYKKIFDTIGLKYHAVDADSGAIGGAVSCEFQAIAKNGEDITVFTEDGKYAANLETAVGNPVIPEQADGKHYELFATPKEKTCEEVANLLNIHINNCVKSLVYEGIDGKPVLLLILGGDTLNLVKAGKLKILKQPLEFSSIEALFQAFNSEPGFLGPIGFNGAIVVDNGIKNLKHFICGANKTGYHYKHVELQRDCKNYLFADIRNVCDGDTYNDSKLLFENSIEIGHVFQLGTKYSKAMNVNFIDKNNMSKPIEMGCYGIGITRLVATYIEQNHTSKGMNWPLYLAPFTFIIIPINYHTNAKVKDAADLMYKGFQRHIKYEIHPFHAKLSDLDIMLDDRDMSFGTLIADSELLGVPYRIVVSEKTLSYKKVEFTLCSTMQTVYIDINNINFYLLYIIGRVKCDLPYNQAMSELESDVLI